MAGMIDLHGMGPIDVLKLLAVELVSTHGMHQDHPLILKLVTVTREMMSDETLVVAGAPEAENPDNPELAQALVDVLFKGYIGHCVSRKKAMQVTANILATLTSFYEAEERKQIMANQGDKLQ